MPEPSPLAKERVPPPRVRRAVLGLLVVLSAVVAIEVGGATPPAFADVATAEYSIGTATNAVADVVAAPSTVPRNTLTNFVVDFRATAALTGTGANTVTVASSSPLANTPGSVALKDDSNNACSQTGTNGGVVSPTTIAVELASSCTISAGDKVEVEFSAAGPASTGIFDFSVTTSANGAPASSNSLAVGEAPPILSATSVVLGANANYTLEDASWTALLKNANALVLTAKTTAGTTISWSPGPSGYSVTYTPPGGVATVDTVTSVQVGTTAVGNDTVTLALAVPVLPGVKLNVTLKGTNPSTTSTDLVSVTPEAGAVGALSQVAPSEASTNGLAFGTAVTAVSVMPAPAVAAAPATYVVGFQATTKLVGGTGASICLSEQDGPTNFFTESGALVSDTTAGWHYIADGLTYPSGDPPANGGCDQLDNGVVIPLATGFNINAGDSITITMVGVTNPPSGTVADFTVATSADTVGVGATPYAIGASGTHGVVVSVGPDTTGALATYTISNLRASAELAAGSSTLTLQAPPGTVFPNNPGSYTVQDATTPSGSGSVSAPISGGGTNDVTLTVPDSIRAGDLLDVTAEDVINPSSAATSYSITLLGNVTGPRAVAPFPDADQSYPNGAIVSFSGKFYVFAGGRAFRLQNASALAAVEKVDHAEAEAAPAGTGPPLGAPRPGTLIFTRPVDGTATIYVAGSDGELHGFATPKQFLDDGYDPALVVTVPNLGQLGVGASAGSEGAAGNALANSADGALVASSGAYYVFAGGRAFGIPTPAKLATVRRSDKAHILKGAVGSTQKSAVLAGGELLSVSGTVYVSYQGDLYPFKSIAQLRANGYGGTAALTLPATAGLPVVIAYSRP
jgi:hypothetical protein